MAVVVVVMKSISPPGRRMPPLFKLPPTPPGLEPLPGSGLVEPVDEGDGDLGDCDPIPGK